MNKEFTPHEQALALKELGFDEECLGYYNIDPSLKHIPFNPFPPFEHEWCLPAPLCQQAFRWFRDNHRLDSIIGSKYNEGKKWYFRIETPPTNGYQYFEESFSTYEEAELACLKKLIEIIKNK
jgi:hypothetical protein